MLLFLEKCKHISSVSVAILHNITGWVEHCWGVAEKFALLTLG